MTDEPISVDTEEKQSEEIILRGSTEGAAILEFCIRRTNGQLKGFLIRADPDSLTVRMLAMTPPELECLTVLLEKARHEKLI